MGARPIFAQTTFDSGPSSCSYSRWTEPDSLALGPQAGRLMNPSLVPTGDTLYIAAATVSSASKIGVPSAIKENPRYDLPSSLWVGRLPGPEALDLPPGDFVFKTPRGVVGPDGAFHLVWAEPSADSLAKLRSAPGKDESTVAPRAHTVYHARYSSGQWSTPKVLFEKEGRFGTIYWHKGQGPTFRVDPDGSLHLFFRWTPRGAIHLRRTPVGIWHHDTLDVFAGTEHALAFGEAGHVVRTYIGEVNDYSGSVVVAQSHDGGRSWGDTTVVHRGAPGMESANRANTVDLVGLPSDTLHLVWGLNENGSFAQTHELWHLRSTDGGETWTSPTKLDLPHTPIMDLEVVQGTCGRVHAIFHMIEPRPTDGEKRMFGRVYYARWNGEGWSSLRPLTKKPKSVTGMGLTRWNDKLWLVWGQMSTWQPASPVTVYQRSRILQSAADPKR